MRPSRSAAARAASSAAGTRRLHSAISAGRPTCTPWPSTTPSAPSPSRLVKSLDARQRAPASSRAAAAIARAIGCSEASSSAPASRSTSARVDAVGEHDVDEAHAAGGDRAGLVEHDRVDAARRLEDLRALDQQAELGAAAGADEQRGRRREAERARAGDDQHRDGGGEGELGRLAGAEPEAERRDGEADDDRDEDARDAVGEPLDGRLAGLGLGHEPRDLRERGVGADPGRAHDEAAAGVDRRARDLVAGLLLDRHRLAGEQRLVDGARALLDDAVGGDLLAGPDDEAVADGELLDRDAALGAVGVEHGDVLGAELEQRRQRGAGAALGARLEVAAGEQERRHDRADLEVDLVRAAAGAVGDQVELHPHAGHAGVAEEERVQRPAAGREHADGDQRVHRRGAVLEVRPRRAVERPRAPQDHRRGELQAQPLPVVELQRADHRERQHAAPTAARRRAGGGAAARPSSGLGRRPPGSSAGSAAW